MRKAAWSIAPICWITKKYTARDLLLYTTESLHVQHERINVTLHQSALRILRRRSLQIYDLCSVLRAAFL